MTDIKSSNTKPANTKKENFLEHLDHTPWLFILTFGLATSVAGMILWPLFELIWCAVFTHSEFVYSPSDFIVQPIIFGFVFATVLWFTKTLLKPKKSSKRHDA